MTPRFSAENSVYQSRHSYAAGSTSNVEPAQVAAKVEPALQCFTSCRTSGCWTSCFSNCPPPHGHSWGYSACPPGTSCQNGDCVCLPGLTECDGACVDTNNNRSHCGSCGNVCPDKEACQNGQCVCTPPNSTCNGVCTDVQNDSNNCGGCGKACSGLEVCCNGICTGTVPMPLYSNSNYFIDNACQNILGLGVTLNVTQNMVSDSGFMVQLNANSPSGTEPDAAQQYGFYITGNSIQGFINNWRDPSTQIVCGYTGLCATPLNNGIPAGYTLFLQLINDSSGNVVGTNFQVFDNNDDNLANATFLVENAGCTCGGTCLGFQQGDLSPITAFTVDIVGPGNRLGTTFSSGGGTIRYSASGGSIAPLSSPPACVETDVFTEETSNASYGTLNGCPAQIITQPFSFKPRNCSQTNGPCTGAGGSDQCITVNGVTQCCHSNWFWGRFPWIIGCSDGQIENQGCSGPCY